MRFSKNPDLASEFFSFDVFDTCITRMHAYPRDLFYDLGLRLVPISAPESARQRFARRFQRARIRAEKVANWRVRLAGGEHSDIFGIYRHIRWLMRLEQSLEELVGAELALEEESLYPVDETVAHIRQLREQGHRIIFISDMYIPARLLGPLLGRKGVMQECDALYVSCDAGTSKHSGGLFQYVLQAEGLTGPDVLHTGDNAHADIAMAQALGMRTCHFSAAQLTEREAIIGGLRIPRSPAASWQAAFSRRCRLATRQTLGPDSGHALDGVIFGVIVPFLLAYVQWVLDDARQRGIQRLYFVSRDGEILLKIARELKPTDLELRYLYGSRRAWLAPSVLPGEADWKRLLAVAGNASAPHDIATRAGLNEAEQIKIRSILNMDESAWNAALSQTEARTFVDMLADDTACQSVLLRSAAAKRDTTLAYLRQEGLLDECSWALVDAGWSLNGQAALKRILSVVPRLGVQPQGYYVGLARDFLDEASAGLAFSFCQPPGSIFSRRRVVVEHCFLPATHASTRGYLVCSSGVAPDFSPDPRNEDEIEYARRLHVAASIGATLVAGCVPMQNCVRAYTACSKQIAIGLIRTPNRHDALAYSSLAAVADMRQEREFSQPLCRPLAWADVWATMGMAFSRKKAFNTSAWMWLEGSIALSPWYIALPLKLMLEVDGLKNRLRQPDLHHKFRSDMRMHADGAGHPTYPGAS